MSSNALKRENTSASANVLMCKQWWKVCWMYGDQEKYYRQLYGKRAQQEKKKFAEDARVYENTKQGFNLGERTTPGINSLDLTREIDE
ncbi:Protein prickle-like Protein [Tribolium castaneum]|nr:Protein prickle-like Protein [Tribolium castaneum]